jgi:hypothetical protein
MPFITAFEKIPAFKITKQLGLPNMCGWAIPGWSECGDDNNYSGVYQARRRRIGNNENWRIGDPKPLNFFMRPYWPTQPPSALRDAQQDKFKTALLMWQALTSEQKMFYNRIATRRSKRGYDLFMSQTLKSL